MKEDILRQIKNEVSDKLAKLDEYNNHTRLLNEKVEENNKKYLSRGLPLHDSTFIPEKTTYDIIFETYKKHIKSILPEETNQIFVYLGTYKPNNSKDEFDSFDIETELNDPNASYRRYADLEGLWEEQVPIEKCEEFEKSHTVIYDDYNKLLKEFLISSICDSQDKAVSRILRRK